VTFCAVTPLSCLLILPRRGRVRSEDVAFAYFRQDASRSAGFGEARSGGVTSPPHPAVAA